MKSGAIQSDDLVSGQIFGNFAGTARKKDLFRASHQKSYPLIASGNANFNIGTIFRLSKANAHKHTVSLCLTA